MSEQYYENEVIDIQDEDVDVVETTEEATESKNGLLGLVIGGAVAVVGAGVALYKNRDKIKQARVNRQIKKLEKKGYCISKVPVIEVVPDAVDEEEETTEE